jgi:hypothetical protein
MEEALMGPYSMPLPYYGGLGSNPSTYMQALPSNSQSMQQPSPCLSRCPASAPAAFLLARSAGNLPRRRGAAETAL